MRLVLVWLLRPLTSWLNELRQFKVYYQSLGSLKVAIFLFVGPQKKINLRPCRRRGRPIGEKSRLPVMGGVRPHPVIIVARLKAQKTLTAATSGRSLRRGEPILPVTCRYGAILTGAPMPREWSGRTPPRRADLRFHSARPTVRGPADCACLKKSPFK